MTRQTPFRSDVYSIAWHSTRKSLGAAFWPLAIIIFVLSIIAILLFGPIGMIPLFLAALYWQYKVVAARKNFWKTFATEQGWKYAHGGSWKKEHALMFYRGHSKKIPNVVTGELSGQPFRIFEYRYTVGSGKHKKTYSYTIFEARFAGHFPHLYLNNRHNSHSAGRPGVKIPLPASFEKEFHLFGPEQYEIEALQIFTPDVLEALLQQQFPYDVELVEQELLIFTKGSIHSRTQLDQQLRSATALIKILSDKLNRMRFKPIGSHSHSLRS